MMVILLSGTMARNNSKAKKIKERIKKRIKEMLT